MTKLTKPLLLATVIAACTPGIAAAEAPWSAAQPIAGTDNVGMAHVVFTRAGHGLAAYSTVALVRPLRTATLHGAQTTGSGVFGPARDLGRLNLTALGTYGSDRVIAFGTTGARHPRPAVAYGTPDAGFGAAHAVGPGRDGQVIDGAVNDRGDAAALLLAVRTPYLVVRRPGHPFGRAVRLGRGPTISGAVAVNTRGDVLVVWERPLSGVTGARGIYARVRTSGGQLSKTRRLGTSVPAVSISAALDDARHAVVAWLGQRVSEGDVGSPATIKYAAARPGQPFGPERTVEVVDVTGTGRYVTAPGVRAAIGADGRALLAWTGYQDGRFVVRAAPVSDGVLGDAQIVSDPSADSVLAALSTGPHGEAVVLARQGIRGADPAPPSGGITLTAAARAAGQATFGPVEIVHASTSFVDVPGVAFDPIHDSAVAVWSDFAARGLLACARAPLGQ
jgi:hypothetical protein